jgi:hypothetical protein
MRPSTHACRSSDLDTPADVAGVSKRDVKVSCAVGSGIWSALAEVAQAATPTLSNMKIREGRNGIGRYPVRRVARPCSGGGLAADKPVTYAIVRSTRCGRRTTLRVGSGDHPLRRCQANRCDLRPTSVWFGRCRYGCAPNLATSVAGGQDFRSAEPMPRATPGGAGALTLGLESLHYGRRTLRGCA